ncbi:MAG: SLC13 family permease [Pseudobdellovibrionaceae bacterium]
MPTLEMLFVFVVLAAIFYAFVTEKLSPDTVAMAGFGILIAAGVVSSKDALSVFSNSAPITIGAMFVISAALERTGCIEWLGQMVKRYTGRSQLSILIIILPVVILASAFMNNTPVVVVLTPLMISLGRQVNIAGSKLLIPLSYSAILGGTTTLIGTSTNLLVAGIAAESGMKPFGIFDITLPGLMMAGLGFIAMMIFSRFLLPDRRSLSSVLGDKSDKKYLVQLYVTKDSRLIGQKLSDSTIATAGETKILDVIRHRTSFRFAMRDMDIQGGDRIIVQTNSNEVMAFYEHDGLDFSTGQFAEIESSDDNVIVEGIVGPNTTLVDVPVSSLQFRRNYGVYIMGIYRDRQIFESDFFGLKLQVGDALMLVGAPEDIKLLFEENGLTNLSTPDAYPIRRHKSPIALLTLLAVVSLAAFNVMPIEMLAIMGAVFIVVTGCIEAKDIYKVIDWPILFLIFGMLGVSMGMEKSGAAEYLVSHLVGFVADLGPLGVLAGLYILTSVLTEMISNNAVAALLTPIVISLCHALGYEPVPFLVALMFAASASFATPIGYQTNTFVYGAGNYKFVDFLKIGIPMNILMFFVAMFAITTFWDLH